MGKVGTRAAQPGNITSATDLKDSQGFGIFAYHTTALYSSTGVPNFMYNQHVTGDGAVDVAPTTWTYSPLKYWPNNFVSGAVDTQDPAAQGNATNGYVSFFAYAPYLNGVAANVIDAATLTSSTIDGATVKTASDGAGRSTGITKISGNQYVGNPTLTYVLDQNVDLMWGTKGTTGETVTGGGNAGGTVGAGTIAVNKDLTKQKVQGKVDFNFKHALACLAGLKVQLDIDNGSTINGGSIATGTTYKFTDVNTKGDKISDDGPLTKVTVTSVTLGGYDSSNKTGGRFDLATGKWDYTTYSTTGAFSGATYTTEIATGIKEVAPTAYDWSTVAAGVTTTPQDLLTSAIHYLLMPDDTPKLSVSITYIVRTYDENLAAKWSETTQTISKNITLGTVTQGNKYYLTLHLGLTGIKVTASYTDWVDGGNAGDVHLPINVLAE